MSADLKSDNEPYDDINITPMLDLAYVLLVTFIIMTTASVQGIKVDVPKTAAAESLAKAGTRAVTVTNAGDIYLDAYPVTPEELEQRMAQYKAANPALPVVFKGDSEAPYDKVMLVLETLKRLDITEIGLVTKRAQSS